MIALHPFLFLEAHPGVALSLGYALCFGIGAFIDSMPPLPANATFWQVTFYQFFHKVSGRLQQLDKSAPKQ